MIGVAGGTASGKTTVCRAIETHFANKRVLVISLDAYYKPLTEEQLKDVANYNFDRPEAFDFELLRSDVEKLRNGEPADIPIYDYVHHARAAETRHVEPSDVVVIEGILVLFPERLRQLFDLKLYVHADSDERLARRILRDIRERGRDLEGVIRQYSRSVKPAHDAFVEPSQKYADMVLLNHDRQTSSGGLPQVATDVVIGHIRAQLALAATVRATSSTLQKGLDKPQSPPQPQAQATEAKPKVEVEVPKVTVPADKAQAIQAHAAQAATAAVTAPAGEAAAAAAAAVPVEKAEVKAPETAKPDAKA